MAGGPPTKRRRPAMPMGTGASGSDPCDFQITVDLIGVRREIAGHVSAGDTLEVALLVEAAAVGAVCRTSDGGVVGALAAFPGLTRLLLCLEQGVPYIAQVDEVSATRCTVTVSRIGL